MSILVDENTKVIVQGISGMFGRRHAPVMRAYGTNVVAGVTPGRLGETICGVPVFDTVKQAVEATGADASCIFVPPAGAAASIMEAADAGLKLAVCVTENVPMHDMLMVKEYLSHRSMTLIGPNCPGMVAPGCRCKIGFIPNAVTKPGHIGVISRSGSLTYETIWQLTKNGLGQSTVVGIGGDSIKGMDFIDVMKYFADDDDTYAVVIMGEIGGLSEVEGGKWFKEHSNKPCIAFIDGQFSVPGKRMGHAGAVISGGGDSAVEKMAALNALGVPTAPVADLIGATVKKELERTGILDKCLSA